MPPEKRFNVLPRHVAIIPDANRRWARARRLPVWRGHLEGVKRFKEVADEAWNLGIRYLTFWGGSVDNIKKRPRAEVSVLFRIYRENFLKIARSREIKKRKVKVRVLGEWPRILPKKTREAVQSAIEATTKHDQGHLTFLLGYDGRLEMLSAVNAIASNFAQHYPGAMIDEKIFKAHLYTRELPPVDLVIRTGGEPHWSAGFLMWDVAYAQLYFTKTPWPDFGKNAFRKALEDYARRERRMGK